MDWCLLINYQCFYVYKPNQFGPIWPYLSESREFWKVGFRAIDSLAERQWLSPQISLALIHHFPLISSAFVGDTYHIYIYRHTVIINYSLQHHSMMGKTISIICWRYGNVYMEDTTRICFYPSSTSFLPPCTSQICHGSLRGKGRGCRTQRGRPGDQAGDHRAGWVTSKEISWYLNQQQMAIL
jgi:hypothetical protein